MDYSVAVHEVGNIVTLMKYSISKLKEEYPEIMGSNYFEYIEADTQKLKELMMTIPQIIDESVPIGKDDSENVELEKFNTALYKVEDT